MARPSYCISIDEAGDQAVVRGFLWLKRRVEETRRDGLLIVPSEEALLETLKGALGESLVDLLVEERELPLGNGVAINLVARDGALPSAWDGPALYLLPDVGGLAWLDALAGVTMALAVPACADELQEWLVRWNAGEPPPEDYSRHFG